MDVAFAVLLFVSICCALLAGFPVAFTLAGVSLIFAFLGSIFGIFDVDFLSAFPQRIFAIMKNEVLIAVPLFVLMGIILERSKIAEELLENMGRLFGTVRGGLAFSVSIVGALMAASTGIVGATVVTMGLLSLPAMLRHKYSHSFSCGTICAAGTLGQVIPPSIVLVLLGDQLSSSYQKAQYDLGNFAPDTVSVNDLFAGALIPGLVLVGLYMLYQAWIAWRHPKRAPALSDAGDAHAGRLLRSLFPPIMLIVAVLGSILGGLATPTEAASVGALGALLLAGHRAAPRRAATIWLAGFCFIGLLVLSSQFDLRIQRREIAPDEQWAITAALLLSLGLMWGVATAMIRTYSSDEKGDSVLIDSLRRTLMITAMVFGILIGASMFSLVFRGFGGDEMIAGFLQSLPGGTVAVLLIVMVTMVLLGFVLDFIEIIYIVVPIVAPVLLQLEVAPGILMSPVWLGVMMAVNLQTSFLTPPFGFSLFYLRGVAPAEVRTIEIYRGVVPFVAIQLLMLVILWFFPTLSTWLPAAIF